MVLPEQNAAAHAHQFRPLGAECDIAAAHAIHMDIPPQCLYLLTDEPLADPIVRNPPASEFIAFSEQRDTAPLLSVLEPISNDTTIAWKASAFGFIIESNEIDACVIPVPNAETSFDHENAHFLDSAIPYESTVSATSFDLQTRHYSRRRIIERRNAFKASSFLVDFTTLLIPRPLRHVIADFINNGIPGLTFLNNVNWIAPTAQFFGIWTESRAVQNHNERLAPHIADHHILVWSPYTHTPVDPTLQNPDHRSSHTTDPIHGYFITNLRSIFGTDPQLVRMQHFLTSMPIP
jgi:hypothetical protein